MLHIRLNSFPVFRNYRDIDLALRFMDVLANAQISMNWNLLLNFAKLKQGMFKLHFSSYWSNVGTRGSWNVWICWPLGKRLGPKKLFWPVRLVFSTNRAVETLLTVHQKFFVNFKYSYRNRAIYELRYQFGSVYKSFMFIICTYS